MQSKLRQRKKSDIVTPHKDLKDLLNPDNRFIFRGKVYRLFSFCPVPGVEMIADDESRISFPFNAPLISEFIKLYILRVTNHEHIGD